MAAVCPGAHNLFPHILRKLMDVSATKQQHSCICKDFNNRGNNTMCMAQHVEDAGGFLEIRNIWGNMSPRR